MYLFRTITTAYLCVFSMGMVSAADKPVNKPSPLALMVKISKGMQAHENSKLSFFRTGVNVVFQKLSNWGLPVGTIVSPRLANDRILLNQQIGQSSGKPTLYMSMHVDRNYASVQTKSEKALLYRQLLALTDDRSKQWQRFDDGTVCELVSDHFSPGVLHQAAVPVAQFQPTTLVSSQPQVVESESPTATIIELAAKTNKYVDPMGNTMQIFQKNPYTEEPDIVRISTIVTDSELRPLLETTAMMALQGEERLHSSRRRRDILWDGIVIPFKKKEDKPLLSQHSFSIDDLKPVVLDDYTRCERRKYGMHGSPTIQFDTIDCTTTISRAAMNEYLKTLGK